MLRHAISLVYIHLDSFAACRSSQHILNHALLWFVSALIQCHSFLRTMPRRISPQCYLKDHSSTLPSLQALIAGPLLRTALLPLCFCMNPEGFLQEVIFFPHIDILRGLTEAEEPETDLERTVLFLENCPQAKHTPPFWYQSNILKRVGSAAGCLGVKPPVPACYDVLQEKKIFGCCYFSLPTPASGVNPQNPA